MSYATVVDTAISQVGTTEYPPNSNKVKYNTEYYGQEVSGDAYPWCITFLWWCFTHGGESAAFYGGNKTASSTQLMNYYIGQEQFVTSGYKIGDIVFYNFSGGSGADHAEIIISVGNGVYVTVGGNTTPGDEGSQNNGGCVARKTRYASQFLGAGRPSYGSSGGGSTEPTALRTKIIQATSRVLAMRHLVPESVAAIGEAEIGPFSVSGVWWVDYRGRIYDRSGNYLRVRNGFTDEVIDMSEPCVGRSDSEAIKVFDNVLGYCVQRESREDPYQTWRFRYYDGTVSEIKMPFIAVSYGIYFTDYYDPFWGYSNGILAISHDGKNNQRCWTYTKNGDFIFETANLSGGVRWPCIERVFPLSGYSVGVIKSGSNFAETYYWDSYSILSDTCTNVSNDPLFAPYYPTFPSGTYKNKQATIIGEDNRYFYAAAKMYDSNGDLTGEWVIAKFNKYDFAGPIEITRYYENRSWKTVSESKIISYSYKKYESLNLSPSDFQYMHIIDSNDVDIYDPNENPMEQGTLDNSGRDGTNITNIRTNGYIQVTEGETYQISSNLDIAYIFFYNSSYAYRRKNGWITLPNTFTVPSGSVYMRVVLSKQQAYYCKLMNMQTGTKYMNGKFDFENPGSSDTFYGAYDNNAYIWIDKKGVFRKRGY